MADHRGQHRDRDIPGVTGAELSLEQVEEEVVAGVKFRHVLQAGGVHGGGRRADTDLREDDALGLEALGGGHGVRPLLLGDPAQGLGPWMVVGVAAMGIDALEAERRRRVQDAGGLQKRRIVQDEPATPEAAVELEQDPGRQIERGRARGDAPGSQG